MLNRSAIIVLATVLVALLVAKFVAPARSRAPSKHTELLVNQGLRALAMAQQDGNPIFKLYNAAYAKGVLDSARTVALEGDLARVNFPALQKQLEEIAYLASSQIRK